MNKCSWCDGPITSGHCVNPGCVAFVPVVPFLPDSGQRRAFSTGSVRDVATGKGRWDLLPYYGLKRWADRLEAGATKYGERNWEKGQPISVLMDSAIRHLFRYLAGWADEDHLGAALWNVGAAAEMEGRVEAGDLPPELLDLPRHRGQDSAQGGTDGKHSAQVGTDGEPEE